MIGSGAVYSFDPVGSYEREACRAAGAGQSLVQPFLDNQVSIWWSSCRVITDPSPPNHLLTCTHCADLLQEPEGSPRDLASGSPAVEYCAVPCYRLFH